MSYLSFEDASEGLKIICYFLVYLHQNDPSTGNFILKVKRKKEKTRQLIFRVFAVIEIFNHDRSWLVSHR